jgi:CBS domain-containing protein
VDQAAGPEDVARFLAEHRPFAGLSPEALARAAAATVARHYPSGATILRQGTRVDRLHVVARGRVELRATAGELVESIGPGEVFGQLSVLAGTPMLWHAVAGQDTDCYLIARAEVGRLRDLPGFEAALVQRAGERIRHAIAERRAGTPANPFTGRARDLIARPLVTCQPGETVRAAAERMRDEQVSSLVVDGEPLGFLTDRDLRDRVVAPGTGLDTPVAAVMTTPLITTQADSTVVEMLLTIVDRGIHHLPVTEAGRLVGMVTDTDLLRHESRHPLFLRRRLERADDDEDLAAYAAEVHAAVARLVDAETPVDDIGRLAASAHDALVGRVLRDAEGQLGPPPAPYAFLVVGSHARLEATLHTDQDHAIALADDAGPEAEAWAAALADRVVAGLERCGFPRCPGGIMASNPRWRVPLSTWERYFRSWMEEPDAEALADTTIFFDFRQLGGTLDADARLRTVVGQAAGHPAFLARLALTALRRESPLDLFGQLRGMRQGRRRVLDLKLRGIAGIVDLARVFALEAGTPETNTLVRLRLAAARRGGGHRPGRGVRIPAAGPPAPPGPTVPRGHGARQPGAVVGPDGAGAALAQGPVPAARHRPAERPPPPADRPSHLSATAELSRERGRLALADRRLGSRAAAHPRHGTLARLPWPLTGQQGEGCACGRASTSRGRGRRRPNR